MTVSRRWWSGRQTARRSLAEGAVRAARVVLIGLLIGSLGLGARVAGGQGKLEIPPPRGMVNDFAGVVPAEQRQRVEALTRAVREASRGEIAVVTLADIGTRAPGDVALQIGREWKVGANARVGDQARNAGVVLLVVPKETSSDGRGHVFIATGQGAEGFLTDGATGDIRREAIPLLQKRDYGTAVELMTQRIAEAYGAAFGFSVDSISRIPRRARSVGPERAPSGERGGFLPLVMLVLFVLVLVVATRGRGGSGCLWFALNVAASSRHHGGFGGFGGGGGGGGGFGGFGGGGGFSGGGSGGDW